MTSRHRVLSLGGRETCHETMQLHVHSQIAHVARTVVDGKWRTSSST